MTMMFTVCVQCISSAYQILSGLVHIKNILAAFLYTNYVVLRSSFHWCPLVFLMIFLMLIVSVIVSHLHLFLLSLAEFTARAHRCLWNCGNYLGFDQCRVHLFFHFCFAFYLFSCSLASCSLLTHILPRSPDPAHTELACRPSSP